jgi:hypothetical protein
LSDLLERREIGGQREDQKFPFKLETLSSALSVFPAREVVEAVMFLSFTSVVSFERNFTRIQNTNSSIKFRKQD